MTNNDDEIIYSNRRETKVQAKKIPDGLKEMFSKLMNQELVPWVEKMILTNDFKPLRGFAVWDTGFNTFTVEIFGLSYEPDLKFKVVNPENLILDAEHFESNMFFANESVTKVLLNNLAKQNIIGKGRLTQADVGIAILEHNYVFRILWTADPVSKKRIQNVKNN